MKNWTNAVLVALVLGLWASPFGCGKKSHGGEDGDAGPTPAADTDTDADTEPADTGRVRCSDLTCSGHGTCTESSGTVTCACDEGYTGDDCSACAEGYKQDLDGSCTPLVVADLQAPEGWCDELVQIVCSNIMGCCTSQDIGVLQTLLTAWMMPSYWRTGTGQLSGVTANAIAWKNTAECVSGLGDVCQANYDWLYYALAMGTMTVDLAAANACFAEILAPTGVCNKVGGMIDQQGLCDWTKILIGGQGVGEECHPFVDVAPLRPLGPPPPPPNTKVYPPNMASLGDYECAQVEGGPELACGPGAVCYAKRQVGESCETGPIVRTTVDTDVDVDLDECSNDLVCTGRIGRDGKVCQRLGQLNEPCYPWLFDGVSEGCERGLICVGWDAEDAPFDPASVTPGTCLDTNPSLPHAALGAECRFNGRPIGAPDVDVDGDADGDGDADMDVDCLGACEDGMVCTLGTCSDDPLQECFDNKDCAMKFKKPTSLGQCATMLWPCIADCDCRHCSVTMHECRDDYDCGTVIQKDVKNGVDSMHVRGKVCNNGAPLNEEGIANFECVNPEIDCGRICAVTRDLCVTECESEMVCKHNHNTCNDNTDCPICSNDSRQACWDENTDGLADNCPSRHCVGNPNDRVTCTSNDDCVGFCGGLLLERRGKIECSVDSDCYVCSLDDKPCKSDSDCPRRGGDTENNRCVNANIACITSDVCEPPATCVPGTCLENPCVVATECVDETCVTDTCGPSLDFGSTQPATCQNRKCVDASSYHVGYCGSGAEMVSPGYYDLMYY